MRAGSSSCTARRGAVRDLGLHGDHAVPLAEAAEQRRVLGADVHEVRRPVEAGELLLAAGEQVGAAVEDDDAVGQALGLHQEVGAHDDGAALGGHLPDEVEHGVRRLGVVGAPIYVRHEVVHNKFVVDRLRGLGPVFVEELDEVPAGATVIFSAHGVSKAVQDEARRRGLRVFDATCPLVTKVHMEVTRYAREGRDVILIGHEGHPEVEGTMGQFDASLGGRICLVEDVGDVEGLDVRDPESVGVVTQTTLSVDDTAEVLAALQLRFPTLRTPRKEDICYATQNRQDAVKKLVENCDVVVVVGSQSSSNSNRLREIAEKAGKPGYLVDGPDDLRAEWFAGKQSVGVTAGASAPELLVQRVVARLKEWGGQGADEVVGRAESVVFALPRELRPGPVSSNTP